MIPLINLIEPLTKAEEYEFALLNKSLDRHIKNMSKNEYRTVQIKNRKIARSVLPDFSDEVVKRTILIYKLFGWDIHLSPDNTELVIKYP